MQTNAVQVNQNKVNIHKNEKFKYSKRLTKFEKKELFFQRIFIWLSIIIVLFPIVCIIGASLGTGDSFFNGSIIPENITFDNYKEIFTGTDVNFVGAFGRTVIACLGVGIAQIIMTVTAAYAVSRMRFKGRKYGLFSLLILQMFPSMMAIAAIYAIVSKFELQGSMIAYILFQCGGSAFSVWLLKNFIDGIPRELDESAKVDGATHWQIFSKIILPLARPMIAVMFFFTVQGVYNEYVLSSMILNVPGEQTLMPLLKSYISGEFNQHWPIFAAGSIVASIPLVMLFMSLQKYIEKGLCGGAVKG